MCTFNLPGSTILSWQKTGRIVKQGRQAPITVFRVSLPQGAGEMGGVILLSFSQSWALCTSQGVMFHCSGCDSGVYR